MTLNLAWFQQIPMPLCQAGIIYSVPSPFSNHYMPLLYVTTLYMSTKYVNANSLEKGISVQLHLQILLS